jgi:hypothetical protein
MSVIGGRAKNICSFQVFLFDPERAISSARPDEIETLERAVSTNRQDAAPIEDEQLSRSMPMALP